MTVSDVTTGRTGPDQDGPTPEPAPADRLTGGSPPGGRPGPRWGHLAERHALLALTIAIALFFTVFPRSSDVFPTMSNVNVITGSQAVVALIAIAALFPLVAGYFDFSLGAIAATAGVFCAGLMARNGWPLWLAMLLTVLMGGVIGAVNGLLVTRFRMSPFVTTLGMATLLGGIIQWYTGGQTIFNGISPRLTAFGSATFLGLPAVVFIVAGTVLVAWYLLVHTPYGRALYAIGSNIRSARLVGVRVDRDIWLGFVLAGLVSAVAGILQLSRTGGATADAGTSLLFPALAAVFLGATAVNPGFFNVFGTVIGVIFVSVSVSGLTVSGASNWASPVFNGIALLAAVGLSTLLGRRRRAS